ncbi:helicase [Pseudozyma hubeiensis SY62]|uniref:Helicase n=1 Tax=Pseudozyma hubeiensis (strain SY62) TaxID=1305764 RepID=R9NX42_PSEHS|nr:helicase [Pseudozyma hubeiensis SY62]GAC93213.1 helicase [Pseudozyma hubeiensis SY62]
MSALDEAEERSAPKWRKIEGKSQRAAVLPLRLVSWLIRRCCTSLWLKLCSDALRDRQHAQIPMHTHSLSRFPAQIKGSDDRKKSTQRFRDSFGDLSSCVDLCDAFFRLVVNPLLHADRSIAPVNGIPSSLGSSNRHGVHPILHSSWDLIYIDVLELRADMTAP